MNAQKLLSILFLLLVTSQWGNGFSVATAWTISPVTIQIDSSRRYQIISGFGASLTPFETDGIYKAHDPTQPERVTATQ